MRKSKIIICSACLATIMVFASCNNSNEDKAIKEAVESALNEALATATLPETKPQPTVETTEEIKEETEVETTKETEAPVITEAETTSDPNIRADYDLTAIEADNPYYHNDYYDVVEVATYSNSYGDQILIQKVIAKKDAIIDGTILVFDKNEDVIGKETSDMRLIAGQANFYRYTFDTDISDATFQMKYTTSDVSKKYEIGVEMVKYNVSGDTLYVTFKQLCDKLDSFSKFKFLFYKDGNVVGSVPSSFFDIYAKNLNEKNAVDVVELGVNGVDFDTVEYYFEP